MEDKTMHQRLTELHLKKDIGMYYCGKRVDTLNHTYGPEIRNHYLFVLVDKGKAQTCDGKPLTFCEHDLFVMCPNTKIHYKALTSWSITWLGLYGEAVKEYMDILGVTPQSPVLHITLYNELKAIMDRIYDVSKNMTIDSRLHISGLIYEFFSILMKTTSTTQKTDLIDSALRIIDYNFCENISIERIAERLGINSAYFSRKFTEKTGLPPKKYILKKRIERAKELLCTTDAGIFEVSNSVGYEDQFYFCRVFKHFTGFSPSEYRKSIK